MILGQDVVTYFQVVEQESPCHKEFPDQSTIVAWMHCHENGVKCHLSSIDLHRQFLLEKTFPHILAIVVEINPKGKQKHEFCRLSQKGIQKINSCNQEECGPNQNLCKQSVPHKACSYPRFSEFVKKEIIFNNGTFKVIENNCVDEVSIQEDTSESNASQPKLNDIKNELIECRGCKKKVGSIRLHLRSKVCRQHYSNEEHSQFLKAKEDQKTKYMKEYLKDYLKEYRKNNVETIKEQKAVHSAKNQKSNALRQRKCRASKRQSVDAQNRILSFKRDIIDGPNSTCFSCNRCLFKNSVKVLRTNDIEVLLKKIDSALFVEAHLEDCMNLSEMILCHTCFASFKKNKLPSINTNNGLELDAVPEELSCISDLEQQLIALSLLFMTIKKLPTSRMGAVVKEVICVPIESSDVAKNVSQLPRHPSNAEIIAVKLKKKLEYKSAYLEEFIRPKTVITAVEKLKECGNKYYQNINVDKDFMNNNIDGEEKEDNVEKDAMQNDVLDSISDESEDENEDPVKRHQSKQSCETCLTPMNLEAKVVSNTTSQTISKATGEGRNSFEIAPGENKIPTNRLRQIDGDVKAFPKHYPSGKYGINYPRKYKLTNQMFFNQRLLNADERFSKDNLYVFMASTFIEQEQLEKQINISGMRGSSKPGADGETVVNLQDLFSVFKSIKGTPKYWQTAKYELIAKVKQLGPFHLFFTFSCGEMM